VHDRGSQGWRTSVDPDGAARSGLSARGPGTVVVVTDPPDCSEGTLDVEDDDDDEPGTVVEEAAAGGFTARLDPVTTTTSVRVDEGRDDPTSMVLVVEEPTSPPVPVKSPGSYPTTTNPDRAAWTRRASPRSSGLA
jgi:hypothetical protein